MAILENFLNRKVRGQFDKLKGNNPLAASAIENLIGEAFPGYGFPETANNVFEDAINERVQSLIAEAELFGASYKDVSTTKLTEKYDWRARLRPKEGGKDDFYSAVVDGNYQKDHLLRPIQESNGMVWQYTPTIFVSATANYNAQDGQGTNYPINVYMNSTPPEIPVAADWTANDIYEARYLLAVMTFLRVSTKGYFGDKAVEQGKYGTPPPVLIFEYLGDHGFNKVPVVVTNYNMQLPEDVDYVPVEVEGTVTYVPTRTNIMVNLTPTYTPHKLRRRFDLDAITNGIAYKDGFI